MSVNLSTNRDCSVPPSHCSQPDDFLRLLPPIQRSARQAFRRLDPDTREDAIQEVVANAFAAYHRLLERGKAHVIAPEPLARFAIAQTRAGRRVGGQLNIDDVTSHHCQYRRGIELVSMGHVDETTGTWEQILVEDPSSSPADIAAIRIDFEAWMELLPHRQRSIAEVLSTGETTSAVAKLFDVTSGRISQLRSQLKAAWEAFQGEEPEALLALA